MNSRKTKQSHDLADWSAQSWLCRKFIQEMRANNVNRIMIVTEDNGGNLRASYHNVDAKRKQKKLITFLSA